MHKNLTLLRNLNILAKTEDTHGLFRGTLCWCLAQHPRALARPPITCLTILLLSRPYMRSKDPQFLTCGCSSCRIF